MSIVPIAKVVIDPKEIFYDFVYQYLLPMIKRSSRITIITGKYIITDNIMSLVSWKWDFYDLFGTLVPNKDINVLFNPLIEKILVDIAQSLTKNNFIGYQPIKNNQIFTLTVDFHSTRVTKSWHQDSDGSVFIGLVYLPNRKMTKPSKVPSQQITLVIPKQAYTGHKDWQMYPLLITPRTQKCLRDLFIIEKDIYPNEIIFINNLTNFHVTPCNSNYYLFRLKIKI
jgi:hypothetical protein